MFTCRNYRHYIVPHSDRGNEQILKGESSRIMELIGSKPGNRLVPSSKEDAMTTTGIRVHRRQQNRMAKPSSRCTPRIALSATQIRTSGSSRSTQWPSSQWKDIQSVVLLHSTHRLLLGESQSRGTGQLNALRITPVTGHHVMTETSQRLA